MECCIAHRCPRAWQTSFCQALGAAAVFVGLRLVWLHINGTFLGCAKKIFIALAAITVGHWLGRLLGLQEYSNRLGRRAANLIAATKSKSPATANNGFIACTILFCAAPLGWLGAATDGLAGDFYLLALKCRDGCAGGGGFLSKCLAGRPRCRPFRCMPFSAHSPWPASMPRNRSWM
ncbi:MAG: DUF554 family protein [Limisphaerales bacterium]